MVPAQGPRSDVVLIVNPTSGRLVQQARDEVVSRLNASFPLEVHSTTARDSAIELAAAAARNGARIVIAFGGDGHVNEVVNGIARSDVALAVIPGGTMNVFARALGVPQDPLQAAGRVVEVLDSEPRRVPLGLANERYFTFSAGCGFDAEAAELVESDLPAKRRFGEVFFYWSALRVLAGSYRHRSPALTLSGAFGAVPVAMAIACNAGPYAYLRRRPIVIAPEVDLTGGLDVFALKSMRIEALPLYAWRALVSHDFVHHRDAFYASNLEGFEVAAEEPFHHHVDGEPLPPLRRVRFSLVPRALSVLA